MYTLWNNTRTAKRSIQGNAEVKRQHKVRMNNNEQKQHHPEGMSCVHREKLTAEYRYRYSSFVTVARILTENLLFKHTKPQRPIQSIIIRFSLHKYCRGDIKNSHKWHTGQLARWVNVCLTAFPVVTNLRLISQKPTPSHLHFKDRFPTNPIVRI